MISTSLQPPPPLLDAPVFPFQGHEDPERLLADPDLATEEKRQILSTWACDAWAPPSRPTLRWPPGTSAPVEVERLMRALHRLDELDG